MRFIVPVRKIHRSQIDVCCVTSAECGHIANAHQIRAMRISRSQQKKMRWILYYVWNCCILGYKSINVLTCARFQCRLPLLSIALIVVSNRRAGGIFKIDRKSVDQLIRRLFIQSIYITSPIRLVEHVADLAFVDISRKWHSQKSYFESAIFISNYDQGKIKWIFQSQNFRLKQVQARVASAFVWERGRESVYVSFPG